MNNNEIFLYEVNQSKNWRENDDCNAVYAVVYWTGLSFLLPSFLFWSFFLFNTFLYNISQATRVHLAALKHTGYLIVDNSIQFTPIQFIKIITMVQHALCGQFFGQKTKRHVLVCLCKWTNGHLYSTITTYDRLSPNMKEMLFSFHFSSQTHTHAHSRKKAALLLLRLLLPSS